MFGHGQGASRDLSCRPTEAGPGVANFVYAVLD